MEKEGIMLGQKNGVKLDSKELNMEKEVNVVEVGSTATEGLVLGNEAKEATMNNVAEVRSERLAQKEETMRDLRRMNCNYIIVDSPIKDGKKVVGLEKPKLIAIDELSETEAASIYYELPRRYEYAHAPWIIDMFNNSIVVKYVNRCFIPAEFNNSAVIVKYLDNSAKKSDKILLDWVSDTFFVIADKDYIREYLASEGLLEYMEALPAEEWSARLKKVVAPHVRIKGISKVEFVSEGIGDGEINYSPDLETINPGLRNGVKSSFVTKGLFRRDDSLAAGTVRMTAKEDKLHIGEKLKDFLSYHVTINGNMFYKERTMSIKTFLSHNLGYDLPCPREEEIAHMEDLMKNGNYTDRDLRKLYGYPTLDENGNEVIRLRKVGLQIQWYISKGYHISRWDKKVIANTSWATKRWLRAKLTRTNVHVIEGLAMDASFLSKEEKAALRRVRGTIYGFPTYLGVLDTVYVDSESGVIYVDPVLWKEVFGRDFDGDLIYVIETHTANFVWAEDRELLLDTIKWAKKVKGDGTLTVKDAKAQEMAANIMVGVATNIMICSTEILAKTKTRKERALFMQEVYADKVQGVLNQIKGKKTAVTFDHKSIIKSPVERIRYFNVAKMLRLLNSDSAFDILKEPELLNDKSGTTISFQFKRAHAILARMYPSQVVVAKKKQAEEEDITELFAENYE